MKTITIPNDLFKRNTEALTREGWAIWYRALGIEPDAVVRCYMSADGQGTVFVLDEEDQ